MNDLQNQNAHAEVEATLKEKSGQNPPVLASTYKIERAWRSQLGRVVRRAASTADGHLLIEDGRRISLLSPKGELTPLVGSKAGIERFLRGGDGAIPRVGWQVDGEVFLFDDGSLFSVPCLSEDISGPAESYLLSEYKNLLVVTPESFSFLSFDGETLWRAKIHSYGIVPPLVVDEKFHQVWVATESPRTRLIALDFSGEQICDIRADASEPLLAMGHEGGITIGAHSGRLIQQYDRRGSVCSTHQLAEPLLALHDLGSDHILAEGANSLEILRRQDLALISTEKGLAPREQLIAAIDGFFSLRREREQTFIQRFVLQSQ